MLNEIRNLILYMEQRLPADLREAEMSLLHSLKSALRDRPEGRWAAAIKFEGLRIMPVALRLKDGLDGFKINSILLWPDAGATALAKRERPDLSEQIFSIDEFLKIDKVSYDGHILIVVKPDPSDYSKLESLSNYFPGFIVTLNGRLEDPAVGIGSVARKRRRDFISKWKYLYWLQPLSGGALMHIYPGDWFTYKVCDDGYRLASCYDEKPNNETITTDLM